MEDLNVSFWPNSNVHLALQCNKQALSSGDKKNKQLNADNHICRSSRYLLTRRLCDKVTSYTRRRPCDKLDKLQWRLLSCINKSCMYV